MDQHANQNQTEWPCGPGDNSLQGQAMTSVPWKVAFPDETRLSNLGWDRAWKAILAKLAATDTKPS